MLIRRFHSFHLLPFLLLFSVSVLSKTVSTDAEVIAIGDVHGAYTEVVNLLKEIELIDADLNWVGGNKHLVSLGDLVDRGKDSRKVVELIIRLASQAQKAGGDVHLVFGNHEVMLMTGDFRYVSIAEFNAFSDLENDEERAKLFQQYKTAFPSFDHSNIDSNSIDKTESDFNEKFPIGFTGLVNAYASDGYIGKWLRKNGNTVLKINNTLYVHGGISEETLAQSLENINKSALTLLQEYESVSGDLYQHGFLPYTLANFNGLSGVVEKLQDRKLKKALWYKSAEKIMSLQNTMLFSSYGPFWYRGNAYCPELSESYILDDVIAKYSVKHLVIGHSVKYRKLASRYNGMLILADTGMLASYYQGTPSALLINKNGLSAHHFSGTFSNTIYEEAPRFRGNPKSMNDKDIEQFLQEAEIVKNVAIGKGMTKSRVLTLQKGEFTLRALFKKYDNKRGIQHKKNFSSFSSNSDRYVYEIAAYKIDRLLRQYLIPPATLRTIDGDEGVIQLWVENMITENNRIDRRMGFDSICPLKGNLRMLLVFDTLINNIDRNNGNMLWDDEFFITFIDHSRAFGLSKTYPKKYKGSKARLSNLYKERLEALTEDVLVKEVGEYLHLEQIKAIIKRRDFLLKK